jgi:hypothetical protein
MPHRQRGTWGPAVYSALDAEKIIQTIDTLSRRVGERFPDAGLSGVSRELAATARQIGGDAEALSRPNWRLRLASAGILVLGGLLLAMAIRDLNLGSVSNEAVSLVQVIEPAANIAVLAAIGILFLVRSEERWRQKTAISSLHALRSLIHVIDMHQLTKDPCALVSSFEPTESSPRRVMTRPQLVRYLDYCSEMLSLVGKLAALYGQTIQDRAVIDAVNDLEDLSLSLSRKIWQKIMILDQLRALAGENGSSHLLSASPARSPLRPGFARSASARSG